MYNEFVSNIISIISNSTNQNISYNIYNTVKDFHPRNPVCKDYMLKEFRKRYIEIYKLISKSETRDIGNNSSTGKDDDDICDDAKSYASKTYNHIVHSKCNIIIIESINGQIIITYNPVTGKGLMLKKFINRIDMYNTRDIMFDHIIYPDSEIYTLLSILLECDMHPMYYNYGNPNWISLDIRPFSNELLKAWLDKLNGNVLYYNRTSNEF